MQLEDWLDDLCVRFVVNIPAEELVSLERICFQIEEAQWFYEDFIRPLDPSLPSLSLKPFFQRITPRCPTLKDWPDAEMATAFERFLLYKNRVPVRGAILLNEKMDEVLLVKGWKKNGTWSFPRGKINKGEDDLDCAVREAWEETGFDLRAAGLMEDSKKIKHIEKTMRSQNMKLFVFRGVPQDAHFVPQTRKEISKIEWFRLADLPTEKRRTAQEGSGQHLVLNANKFYVVAPFMHDLKRIINAERRRDNRQSSKMAVPPITADAPDVGIPQQFLPISPAIPSSLPEVAPTQTDSLSELKQQFNIAGLPASLVPSDPHPTESAAKANALLSLLRTGPATKTRDDSQTLYLPEQNQLLHASVQSPPPVLDMHQQIHPVAPPSSAVPQLSHHTRSLLDAFKLPVPQTLPTRSRVPPAKQNLLAAFGAAPSNAVEVSAHLKPNQGDTLLQLLQRSPDLSHAVVKPPPPHAFSPLAQAPDQNDNTMPYQNPLLGLLKTQQPPQPAIDVPPVHRTPAELSATSDSGTKPEASAKSKNALLSLLGANTPVKPAKSVQPRARNGLTAATLERPLDQPQFEAIAKTSSLRQETPRSIKTEKKLFDHRSGNVESVIPSPIKIAKYDDRNKAQKSPRNLKPKQVNTPRRPTTPKEPTKPFQPQILKRPQISEGDLLSVLLPARPKNIEVAVDEQSLPIVSPPTPTQAELGPASPILETTQPVLPESSSVITPIRPSHTMSPVYDPQREALLSLLKAPSPVSMVLDSDATPKAHSIPPHYQMRIGEPTSQTSLTGQIISPVQDNDPYASFPRSRVSSLASTGNGTVGGKPAVEKRQTAASDKAFLMQYLKGFANQEAT